MLLGHFLIKRHAAEFWILMSPPRAVGGDAAFGGTCNMTNILGTQMQSWSGTNRDQNFTTLT